MGRLRVVPRPAPPERELPHGSLAARPEPHGTLDALLAGVKPSLGLGFSVAGLLDAHRTGAVTPQLLLKTASAATKGDEPIPPVLAFALATLSRREQRTRSPLGPDHHLMFILVPLATHAVVVSVEAVGVRGKHLEAPMSNLAAIEVGARRGNAERGIGLVAVSPRWGVTDCDSDQPHNDQDCDPNESPAHP
jgi:hypothetical protein